MSALKSRDPECSWIRGLERSSDGFCELGAEHFGTLEVQDFFLINVEIVTKSEFLVHEED